MELETCYKKLGYRTSNVLTALDETIEALIKTGVIKPNCLICNDTGWYKKGKEQFIFDKCDCSGRYKHGIAIGQQKLEIWLNKRIEKAKEEGKEFFLGVPDEWYENPLYCCNNGHISGMYLKSSEMGAVCLSCHEPSHIFPSDATQDELNVALS